MQSIQLINKKLVFQIGWANGRERPPSSPKYSNRANDHSQSAGGWG